MFVPALGRDVDKSLRIDEDGLRRVVPGTSQPYVGDLNAFAGTNDVVHEDIAPLHVGSMAGCHDVATRRTVDFQSVAVQIDVAAIVDEVDGTLDDRVLDVVAVVRGRGGNPGVLIAEQGNVVQGHTVGLCVQGQGLRTSLLLMSPLILEGDALEEGVLALDDHRCAGVDAVGIVATREAAVEHHGLVAVLSDDVQIGLRGGNVDVLVVLSVLDEDEPGLGTTSGSSVDGTLQRGIVAAAVLCHYGVV